MKENFGCYRFFSCFRLFPSPCGEMVNESSNDSAFFDMDNLEVSVPLRGNGQ